MRVLAAWWGTLALGLLAQTALFPLFFSEPWTPCVPRALVLWVALTGVPRGGVILPFAAGVLWDLSSGAPLGFGAALLLTLYAAARPFRGVFFDDRPVLLLPFAVAAPWVEAVVAVVLSRLVFPAPLELDLTASLALRQSVVDAVWVPLVFVTLEILSGRRGPREVTA